MTTPAAPATAGERLRRYWRRTWPVVAVLAATIVLGYPIALLFGLPLAQRDIADLRKWEQGVFEAPAPRDVTALTSGGGELRFDAPLLDERGAGLPVLGGAPLQSVPTGATLRLAELEEAADGTPLLRFGDPLEPVASPAATPVLRLPPELREALPPLYAGDALLRLGSTDAVERPDGQRTAFTFEGLPGASDDGSDSAEGAGAGAVLLDGAVLEPGLDYTEAGGALAGAGIELAEPAPFGSDLRRVVGDAAVLDAAAGTIVLAEPADAPVRPALDVVRLAERLEPVPDGTGRRFSFQRDQILETDRTRELFVGERPLRADEERSEERADGRRTAFTFPSERGIVAVDGRLLLEGRDFTRDGAVVELNSAPVRNARIRNHPDIVVADAEAGEILLAFDPGDVPVWTTHYTFYARPGCGSTVIECFFALPQHPVPFPHWIAERVVPFFGKYALADERNVVRATLYTTAGTLSALGLGGAIGVLLAVIFVIFRPVERALLPWVIASQTIPIIALVPVLLLVLGNFGITIQTSLLPTAIIGAYIAFFPVVVGTVKGLRSVEPLALDLMRSYAATRLQVFWKVRFPAAVPFLFTSLKLGTAAALVGALVAETESNNRKGLGFQILGQVQSGNVADVWILLLLSGLLGIGLVALVDVIHRIVAPWERTA